VFVRSEELPIMLGDVSVGFGDFSGSGQLVCRAEARQYVAALFGRRGEAVTVISGSGRATPSFTQTPVRLPPERPQELAARLRPTRLGPLTARLHKRGQRFGELGQTEHRSTVQGEATSRQDL
jgi:hypothetical protein